MLDRINQFGPSRSVARRGLTLLECLVIVGIVGLLIGLLLPASRSSGRAARRMQCASNMHNIGLGLSGCEQSRNALPIGHTEDADGRPLHSWRTLILPFMDGQELHDGLDLAKPWDDPANVGAMKTPKGVWHCTASTASGEMTTDLGVATPDGAFPPGRARRSDEFADGRSTTFLFVEAGEEHAAPWVAPVDADGRLILGLGPDAKHHHSGGWNACFADGAVRFLGDRLAPELRRTMISVAGHEKIPVDDFD